MQSHHYDITTSPLIFFQRHYIIILGSADKTMEPSHHIHGHDLLNTSPKSLIQEVADGKTYTKSRGFIIPFLHPFKQNPLNNHR